MRNLRKFMAVLVAVAMMLTAMVPAFAAETAAATLSADASVCKDLGMLEGDGTGVTAEYTATTPSRIQAAVLFLRLKGLEKAAKEFKGENFADVKADAWYAPITAYLKANPTLGYEGIGDNKFDPDSKMSAQGYYKVVLTALGYKQDTDFKWEEVFTFAEKQGLKALKDAKTFTIDSLAVATVEGLKATVKGETKTLVAKLADADAAFKTKAEAAKLITAVVAGALDVKAAVAINSTIVEVELNAAATAPNKADITVKDAAGTAIAVKDAAVAPYSTDSKKILVTLEADTVGGTLYTLTANSKSVNFGGKAKDTDKPKLLDSAIVAKDYNEISVEFTEPVKIDAAKFELAEKYGNKAVLEVVKVAYDGNKKVVITTGEQKGSTLYALTVTGVVDFAGNGMDKDDKQSFAGIAKGTDAQKLDKVATKFFDTIVVKFTDSVDVATIKPENFKIEEAYGTTKATVAVTAAVIGAKDNKIEDNATKLINGTKADALDAKKYVFLTVEGTMKDSTLYKMTISGVKSIYGKDMSTTTDEYSKTFTGKAKPTTEFEFAGTAVVINSNTEIKLQFDATRKLDKATAENVATYKIEEAYGNKTALEVTKAVIDSDSNVKLTVGAMKNVLYKVTVTGLKDSVGNNLKTSDSKNTATFAGAAVAEKVKNIVGEIIRKSDTQIEVKFDQKIKNNTDVSSFFIDNGIGYPEKAEKGTDEYYVKLTLPKTVAGKAYKLTVKNLINTDGVAMAADDKIEKTFVGQGLDASKAELQYIIAVDNQTLKFYFDRAADDGVLKGAGRLYADKGDNKLTLGDIVVSNYKDANLDLADATKTGTVYTVKDPDNANALLVRFANADLFKKDKLASGATAFKATIRSELVKSTDNKNIVEFAANDSAVTKPELVNVIALNNKVLRAYFSQRVAIATASNVIISGAADSATPITGISVLSATKIDDMTYDFLLNAPLTSTTTGVTSGKAYFYLPQTGAVLDYTSKVGIKPKTDKTYANIEFGVNDKAATDTKISDVFAQMTDKRTIVVFFPEKMEGTTDTLLTARWAASAANIANYTIVADADGTDAVDSNLIAYVEYDGDNKKATLFLNDDIANLKNGGNAMSKYYIAVSSAVSNEVGANFIKDDKTVAGFAVKGVVREFGASSTTVAVPKIKSVSVNDARTELKVTFDQKVVFPGTNAATYTKDREYTPAGASGSQISIAAVLSALKVTAQFEGETTADAIVAADLSNVKFKNDAVTLVSKIKFAANSQGKATTKEATANALKNRSGIAYAVSGDDAVEMTYGVAASLFSDTTAPTVVNTVYADVYGVAGAIDGIGDLLKINFSENIALNATVTDTDTALAGTQIDAATFNDLLGLTGYTFSGTAKVTLSVSANALIFKVDAGSITTPLVGGTPFTLKANTVKDTAGNILTAAVAQP